MKLSFNLLLTFILFFIPVLACAQTVPPERVQTLFEVFANLMTSLPAWISAFTVTVTAATAITSLTPNKTDDKVLNAILKVLNFLAGNFGKNKNAGA